MRRRLLLPALLLLAALLGVALLVAPRLLPPGEQSPEVRFVREMTQHHTQAVDMAIRIRERSRDEALRTIALDMLLSQQEQIGQMRGWLTIWGRPWGGEGMSAGHARQMGMATPAEVARISTLPPRQSEVQFLQLMTRHHQGALAMVTPVLSAGVRPEVRALARQIQGAQAAEIRLMITLLNGRGAQPLPAPGVAGATEHNH
ncbi:DUF305 domain-containing protein [Deinococcus arcticus]|uniref:DUF305 domain-containing protein n=1 Tax=Deinococcus arcticus TaxID=2136176 RepID=A0A2T3W8T5_9DEIO|nr:DUF305 domain-containing protein [Deinococcus arcticus]PTA68237.1 DUF305 domain-containing protein [Deinococcus arcticus]